MGYYDDDYDYEPEPEFDEFDYEDAMHAAYELHTFITDFFEKYNRACSKRR
jgi:hypothetical protein